MSKTAAIYARVSSDRQKEQNTIASQTAALREYAQAHDFIIPPEWVFEDDGFSGSVLVRPGLESLRDKVAEGEIERVLVLGPDRLSRNYAYQVLLLEEFARHGAEVVFLKAPAADTPEQRLLLQFQGMIAEYERAQIAERCRRGKRHRAKAGLVNVLSSAPYGYRYVKKTETSAAYYEVVESEAEVVRKVFHLYTVEGLSARAMARAFNAENIPTRSKKGRWTASTIWHIINNPAYRGRAAYGKTAPAPRQKINRIARQKGHYVARWPSNRRRPREEWIEIPVPALVSQQSFELAQERSTLNKKRAARHTRQPSLLQSILVCARCGYALCRVSTPSKLTPGGRLYYYRCLGLDRHNSQGPVCDVRPKRVDYLDELVWEQIWQLLNHPELIRSEIQRRLQEHQQSSPVEQRKEGVSREIARIEQQTDKLIDALQEGLIDLADVRSRIPDLKRRQQALEKELASLNLQALEESRLVELNLSMESFIKALNASSEKLDILQKTEDHPAAGARSGCGSRKRHHPSQHPAIPQYRSGKSG